MEDEIDPREVLDELIQRDIVSRDVVQLVADRILIQRQAVSLQVAYNELQEATDPKKNDKEGNTNGDD